MLDQAQFLDYVFNRYQPNNYEIGVEKLGYAPGSHYCGVHAFRFHHILSTVAPHVRPGGTLLDIGSFPGCFVKCARALFDKDLKIVATGMPVDPAFPQEMNKLKIDFVECNLDNALPNQYPSKINIPDNSVDVATCTEMIEHLYSVRPLFNELHRCLKPGGVVYIGTNNIAYLPGLLRVLRGHTNLDPNPSDTSALQEDEWRGHVRFYSLHQLCDLGQRFGFKVLKRGYFSLYPPRQVAGSGQRFHWWMKRMMIGALDLLPIYRSHIFVLLQKN